MCGGMMVRKSLSVPPNTRQNHPRALALSDDVFFSGVGDAGAAPG